MCVARVHLPETRQADPRMNHARREKQICHQRSRYATREARRSGVVITAQYLTERDDLKLGIEVEAWPGICQWTKLCEMDA